MPSSVHLSSPNNGQASFVSVNYETTLQFPKHTLDVSFGESIRAVLTRTATSSCTHCAVNKGTWPGGRRENGSWNPASTPFAKPCALTWGCLKQGAVFSNLHKGTMWPYRCPDIYAFSTWLDCPCSKKKKKHLYTVKNTRETKDSKGTPACLVITHT